MTWKIRFGTFPYFLYSWMENSGSISLVDRSSEMLLQRLYKQNWNALSKTLKLVMGLVLFAQDHIQVIIISYYYRFDHRLQQTLDSQNPQMMNNFWNEKILIYNGAIFRNSTIKTPLSSKNISKSLFKTIFFSSLLTTYRFWLSQVVYHQMDNIYLLS